MANDSISNSYEEARRRRLEDNKKRFEDLRISKISQSLSELKKPEKSPQPVRRPTKRNSNDVYTVEPRRSSRARNQVASYRDDVAVDFPSFRKRRKAEGSWASYLARPLEEVRTASYEERGEAIRIAEELQENLQSSHPTFVKSMVRSHVYSCFWLGLPSAFCEKHLPKKLLDMVLEDEDGDEYEATYIGTRTGLSGGWRAFALEHKLDDGDALVFELIEPARFKVHIVRAGYQQGGKAMKEEEKQVEEQESKQLRKPKKEPQQANKEESKKPKKLKKEPVKQAKKEESKKPKEQPIKCPDENNDGESISQRLRRSTRSTRFSNK